jgi:hypothetical protein
MNVPEYIYDLWIMYCSTGNHMIQHFKSPFDNFKEEKTRSWYSVCFILKYIYNPQRYNEINKYTYKKNSILIDYKGNASILSRAPKK